MFRRNTSGIPVQERRIQLIEVLIGNGTSERRYLRKPLREWLPRKGLDRCRVSLKFDFIIIHESAHEWFGNSVTSVRRLR